MVAKQSDDPPARAAKSGAGGHGASASHAKGAKAHAPAKSAKPAATKPAAKKPAKAPAPKKKAKPAAAEGHAHVVAETAAAKAKTVKTAAPKKRAAAPKPAEAKVAEPTTVKEKPLAPPKPVRKPMLGDEDFVDEDVEAEAADFDEADVRPALPPRPRVPTPAKVAEDEDEEGPEGDVATEAVDVAAPLTPRKKAPLPIPPMPPRRADGTITIAYSPDADDAFMMYALESGKVDTEDRHYALTRADIQGLNDEAKKGTYDVTALSFGAYPEVNDRYALLPCGGSFGDNVGPLLVAKTPIRASEVNGLVVAVPGLRTTAAMVLRLWLPRANLKLVPMAFDHITSSIKAGKVRAGVLIHEGQLTWREDGLVRVADFGQWWGEKTEGLPLPLGGNAIRRDIQPELRAKIALDLKRSIAYALGHREEAVEYASKFARGLDKAKVDKYVSMYVNELTLDVGERGRQAVRLLLDEAHRSGLLEKPVDIEFA